MIPTPGHTAGHCSVLLEERGVLFTGDALVNFDYASGERGVTLHRFNEDRAAARKSLDVLADLDAGTLLFGHGDPCNRGAREAVERAARGGVTLSAALPVTGQHARPSSDRRRRTL